MHSKCVFKHIKKNFFEKKLQKSLQVSIKVYTFALANLEAGLRSSTE